MDRNTDVSLTGKAPSSLEHVKEEKRFLTLSCVQLQFRHTDGNEELWTDVSHMSFVLDLVKAAADIRCVVLLHRFLTFGSAGTNKTPHPALRLVFAGWHRSALAAHLERFRYYDFDLEEYIIRMDSCT